MFYHGDREERFRSHAASHSEAHLAVTEAPFSGNGNERSTETGRQRQLRALLVSLEIGVRLDFHRFHADAGLGVRRAKGARSKDVKLK